MQQLCVLFNSEREISCVLTGNDSPVVRPEPPGRLWDGEPEDGLDEGDGGDDPLEVGPLRGEHGDQGEQGAAHGEGGLDHDAEQGLVGDPVDDRHRLPGTGDLGGSLDPGDLHRHGEHHLEDALGSDGRHQPVGG